MQEEQWKIDPDLLWHRFWYGGMEPLRLGLLGGQFFEGLPKGARLPLDRDTWLRGIFTEWIINK
jgi:hypothetical protein